MVEQVHSNIALVIRSASPEWSFGLQTSSRLLASEIDGLPSSILSISGVEDADSLAAVSISSGSESDLL